MAAGLTERICDLVAQPPALSATDREDILLAFAHAGWAEPAPAGPGRLLAPPLAVAA